MDDINISFQNLNELYCFGELVSINGLFDYGGSPFFNLTAGALYLKEDI
jgi:hypothetical protein